jgi:hypothetical protein
VSPGHDAGEAGTWGTRAAAAQWRQRAAARLAALGPATEMMLDVAGVRSGTSVPDIGAGVGDSALMAARRAAPAGRAGDRRLGEYGC